MHKCGIYLPCGNNIPQCIKKEEICCALESLLKNIRIKQGITLREFCKSANLDPSNWSKIERNILQPPKSKEVLSTIANALNLKENQNFGILYWSWL